MAKAKETKTLDSVSQLKIAESGRINRRRNAEINKTTTNLSRSRACILKLKRFRIQETPRTTGSRPDSNLKDALHDVTSQPSSTLTTQALSPISKHRKCVVPIKRCRNDNQLQERKSVLFNEINNCSLNDEVLKASVKEKNPKSTKMKNCFVRIKRCPQINEINVIGKRITSSPNVPNSGKNTEDVAKKKIPSSNLENCINGKTTQVFTRPVSNHYTKGNNVRFADNQNSNTDVLKTSTPLRVASVCQREPFKELNLQFGLNSVEHIGKQPFNPKEKCPRFTNLGLTKSRNRVAIKSKNNDDISRFEPLKNSTHLETAVIGTTKTSKELETSNKELPSDKSKIICSQNLANKSDLVEQILLSDDLDDVNSEATVQPKSQPLIAANKMHKFFHRDVENSTKNNTNKSSKSVKKPLYISKKQSGTKRRNLSMENIYDFLSQSQTTESDSADKCDPAADIIKRLIKEGKVRVATHKKGTGKLTIKPRYVPKKRVIRRQKKKVPVTKKVEKKKEIEVEAVVAIKDNWNNNDVRSDQIEQPVNLLEDSISSPEKSANTHSKSKSTHDSSAGAGTFSNLARSVLISQTGKQNPRQRVTDQRILLEAALKFVSTPRNKKLPALDKTTDMSSILLQKEREQAPAPTCASPWRVDEDAHLPSVFYFNRNSENLPSFSSDFIPSTPRKQSPETIPLQYCSEIHSPTDANVQNIDTESPAVRRTAVTKNLLSSLSSISSNDSNAENMPPPQSPHVETNNAIKTNDDAINKRQQLNPLRAFTNRSPLKPINILEVITLPPLNLVNLNAEKDKPHTSVSNKQRTATTGEVSDLFGFEEFLDCEGEPQQGGVEEIEENNKSDFRRKLQQLKHLRPKDDEIKTLSNTKSIRAVFDDDVGVGGGRQLNIKEMLCSTMINAPSDAPKRIDTEETAEQELFEENDPAESLNSKEQVTRRTYERPFKQKRKLRHNFVMFMDSDESGEEESPSPKKVGHQKKKHKKNDKQSVEFDSFVTEFNEMCKQVDDYELIVE